MQEQNRYAETEKNQPQAPVPSRDASPALDDIVAVKVMGFRHEPLHDRLIAPPDFPLAHDPRDPAPPFSTDIAAAWLVLDAMSRRGCCYEMLGEPGHFAVRIWQKYHRADSSWCSDASPALAICRAALLADPSDDPGHIATVDPAVYPELVE